MSSDQISFSLSDIDFSNLTPQEMLFIQTTFVLPNNTVNINQIIIHFLILSTCSISRKSISSNGYAYRLLDTM